MTSESCVRLNESVPPSKGKAILDAARTRAVFEEGFRPVQIRACVSGETSAPGGKGGATMIQFQSWLPVARCPAFSLEKPFWFGSSSNWSGAPTTCAHAYAGVASSGRKGTEALRRPIGRAGQPGQWMRWVSGERGVLLCVEEKSSGTTRACRHGLRSTSYRGSTVLEVMMSPSHWTSCHAGLARALVPNLTCRVRI
jgi:hypothetical protein